MYYLFVFILRKKYANNFINYPLLINNLSYFNKDEHFFTDQHAYYIVYLLSPPNVSNILIRKLQKNSLIFISLWNRNVLFYYLYWYAVSATCPTPYLPSNYLKYSLAGIEGHSPIVQVSEPNNSYIRDNFAGVLCIFAKLNAKSVKSCLQPSPNMNFLIIKLLLLAYIYFITSGMQGFFIFIL